MNDREKERVEVHLQIMHSWAIFAVENDSLFFEMAHLKKISAWTKEALKLIADQKQEIKRLKEDRKALGL